VSNVDFAGASGSARLTGSTQPDGVRGEDGFPLASLEQPHYLTDGKIEDCRIRAYGSAVSALVAE